MRFEHQRCRASIILNTVLCIHESWTYASLLVVKRQFLRYIHYCGFVLICNSLTYLIAKCFFTDFSFCQLQRTVADFFFFNVHLFPYSLQLIFKYLLHTVCKCQSKLLLTLDPILRYCSAFASNTVTRPFKFNKFNISI